MSGFARVVAAGLPHHITQGGNCRQNVSCNDGDRITYLGLISEYCEPARLSTERFSENLGPPDVPPATPSLGSPDKIFERTFFIHNNYPH